MLRKLIPLIGLAIALGVSACGAPTPTATGTPVVSPAPVTIAPPTNTIGALPSLSAVDPALRASVRLVLAVPDIPSIDVYLERNLVGSRVAYGSLTSAIALPPGQYLMRVVPATISPDTEDKLLLSETVDLAESEGAIFVLTGTKDKLVLKHVTENKSPLKSGQTRVAIVGAVQGSAKVDISADEQAIASLTGQDPDPQVMKAGRYSFRADAGSGQPSNQAIMLLEHQVFTVVVLGPSNGTYKFAVANSPTLRETKLRALNMSQDLGKVDVYLNNKPLALNLDYRKISDWQTLTMAAASSYNVRVLSAGTDPNAKDTTPITQIALPIKPDLTSDVVLYDPKDNLKVRLLAEDLSPTAADSARLIYLNLAPKVGDVLPVISGSRVPGSQPISYGSISLGIPIPAGTRLLTFGVLVGSTATPGTALPPQIKLIEAPPDTITLKAGTEYFYVVTGQAQQYGVLYFTNDVGTGEAAQVAVSGTTDTMPVRVVNGIADLQAIDIYINGDITFKNVERGKSSPAMVLSQIAGSVTLTSAGDTKILARLDFHFHKDEPDTLIAVGSSAAATLIQSPDLVSEGAAPVRVVNGAPDQAQVTIQAVTSPVNGSPSATPALKNAISVASGLRFGTATGFTPLAIGVYSFVVFGADGNVAGELDNFALEAGKRYDMVVLPGSTKASVSISMVVSGP